MQQRGSRTQEQYPKTKEVGGGSSHKKVQEGGGGGMKQRQREGEKLISRDAGERKSLLRATVIL